MAGKIARRGVSIFIDGSQIPNSVKAIQKEYWKLIRDQREMTIGSEEYIRQTKKIAQLDSIIKEHKGYQAEVAKEYSKMSGAAEDFEKKSKKAFSLDSISAGINKLKGAIVGFIASFTVDKAVNEFAKLDDAQANVIKYTGLSKDEIKKLNKEFDSLDTRTARIRLNELAGDAGRLGIQSRKDILDFVDAANIIDVALGEDLGEGAIKSIGKLAEMFGDADRMGLKQAMLATGSAINEVAQNSSAAEPYLVDFTNRLSGVGNQAGFSISQIIGLGSVLDQNAQQVETSATALSGLMMKMYQEPAKFAKIAGLDVKEFTKLIKEDANEALLTLLDTLGKSGGLDKLAPIFKDMNLNGARSSSILSVLAGNIEKVRAEQKIATDAFKEGKSVINEYDVQNNTFSANLEKQKNILLTYVTDIGEKLAPMILEGASAGTQLMKVLSSIFTILIDNKSAVLAVVTAYITYNLALKANTLWTERSNIASKAMVAGNAILKGSLYALQVAYYSLTGQAAKARGAMVAFGMVTNLTNPIGILTAAVTALGAGLAVLLIKTGNVVTAQKAVKEATNDLNIELGREIGQSNRLFEALKRTNPESEEYRKIKNQIIKLYGPYLQGLIDEEGNLIDIVRAHAQVNNKLREQISLKIKNAATDKIQEASVKEQISDLDNVMNIVEKQMKRSEGYNKEAVNIVRENINKAINESIANGKTGIVDLTEAIQGVLSGEDLDMKERFGFFEPESLYMAVSKLSSGVYIAQGEIKKVEDQFKGMISEATELDSLLSGGGGTDPGSEIGNGGDTGAGDKTAIQRKKLQEALRVLDEQHLKEMSALKQRYLSGDIKTEEEYNQEVLKLQDKADADKKSKLQELLGSLTDPSLRIDIAKQIANIDAKALDRQVADRNNRKKDALKKEQDLIKWNEEETKKIIEAALLFVELEEDKAYIKQMELRSQGKISEEEYQRELTKIQMKHLEDRLLINGLNEKEIAEIRKQILEEEINTLSQFEEQRKALIGETEYSQIINRMIQIDEALINGTISFGEAISLRVTTYLDVLQSMIGSVSSYIMASNQAEEAAINRKYEKEIEAAGNNSRKIKGIEEKRDKELSEARKKNEDSSFRIQTAMALASTAQAAINAYASTAAIPIIGPALAPAAAALASAAGLLQVAAIKKQHDAAKAGYFDGGFTGGVDPKQVRGYLPDGSPVHGVEFVGNRHSTANPNIFPLYDVINEAQKHGTAGSLTKADLARALNIPTGGYAQGGFSGIPPVMSNGTTDTRYDDSYDRFVNVMERLERRLDERLVAKVSITGDDGLEDTQNLYDRMNKNASRN